MKPFQLTDEFLKRQIALVEELNGQSDRGVAIVGAAWLEEAMAEALHEIMEKDEKSWQRLFGPNGPLSTFSAKIDIGRLLGCTTDTIKSDLHIIRGIRNEFAHQVVHKRTNEKLSFASDHVRDKCFALKCVAHEAPETPRAAFLRACAILSADFELLPWLRGSLGSDSRVSARVENAA